MKSPSDYSNSFICEIMHVKQVSFSLHSVCSKAKAKAVPLHAMKALGGKGGITPTHSRPRH
jgi:hypothetical protein